MQNELSKGKISNQYLHVGHSLKNSAEDIVWTHVKKSMVVLYGTIKNMLCEVCFFVASKYIQEKTLTNKVVTHWFI